MAFKFEQLKVWQKAIDFSGDRYDFLKKSNVYSYRFDHSYLFQTDSSKVFKR